MTYQSLEDPEKSNHCYLTNLLGVGLGVDANLRAEKWRCCGPFRYDWSIVLEICALSQSGPEQHLRLAHCKQPRRSPTNDPDAIVSDQHAVFKNGNGCILLQNSPHGGAGLWIAPEAELDDGFLHVQFCDKLPRSKLIKVFNQLKAGGKHRDNPIVQCFQCRKLEFTSAEPKRINVDGENLGTTYAPGILSPPHFTPPLITRGGKMCIPDENPSVWRVSSVGSYVGRGGRGSADRDGVKFTRR